MKGKFAYLAVFVVGLIMSYNTNIFKPESVTATETIKTVQLPPIPGNFKLNLDLETGKSIVESNIPVTSTDITVNHPTKIVEKVVYKKSKPKVVYETKTEVQTRPVMFTLPTPRSHKFVPEYPKSVEK
ncbi:hypothetical protein [uncultured phage cr1_1]|jgi:hypothetical protein|uniref:Uncharacterized protein n=2 Tax=Culoivirus TaxID=2942992 RepID=A0A7M1RVS0_9CAUD|nr:hypothetical protein KNV27_gp093 [uncultured phage cr55_1]YP_010110673.1 hypothetical protein KNV31_gp098 [uncultured phage cr1_1]MEE0660236.1 hypothetical protein [Thomasclavelia ramosa]UVN10354.1 MAG: hypothetical protein [Bacteriophage sp.]DAI01211.1 MAG TPA: hypothetical protein [Caudoviricetes sp.]QOR58132.1 hypothetical protein [uncultured phage cr55_1]QOR58515.1 hypothetical protein [uncultured phage cr1_1]